MTQPYRRFRNPGDEPPATWTEWELTQRKRDIDACNRQLLDLMREYGGKNLGEAKAHYRRLNELDIPPGAERTLIIPSVMHISACSSAAGWMS